MKVLVVEDEPIVAKTLELLLSSYNYAVDIAADGEAGLQMADAFEYDLILLDVLLPRLDGVSVCQQLRAKGFQYPILLLTGQGGARQKAIALNAGADDYVVKPFDSEELIARVQALLRRGGSTTQPILTWGHLSLDPNSRKVTYGIHLLSVTPKEFAILELLLRNSKKVYSARAILDHAWNSVESPSEEAVRVHIKEIRHKLKAVGAPKDFIKTVYQTGYRLNPLYAAMQANHDQQPTLLQVAELTSVNEELRSVLEQLRTTQEELSQKNQELELAHQTIAQERQQLQAAYDELEMRIAERTAELVQANYRLQQREHQWQALFNLGLDAIAIIDNEGHLTDANPVACELFGATKAKLLQTNITTLMAPDQESGSLWPRLLQQKQLSGHCTLRRCDGTLQEVQFVAIAHFIPDRHLLIVRTTANLNLLDLDQLASKSPAE